MADRVTNRTLFVALVREEWRLHARLFGGRRFALYPLVLVGLVGAGVVAAHRTGTTVETLVTSLHLFVLGFGLYTGTAGFVGDELLENVIGDVTLLLSSTRTLPLSGRTLLGLFLLKDLGYYAVLFLLPVALGFGTLLGLGAIDVLDVVRFWLSTVLLFALGMTATVSLIAITTRGVPGPAVGLAIGGAVALGWTLGVLEAAWSGMLVYDGGPLAAGLTAVLVAIVAVGSLAVYDTTSQRGRQSGRVRLGGLLGRVPGDEDGLVAKSLLDVGRSSGGFAKPVVSVGILLGLTGYLVDLVNTITGLAPATGVFFGSILALSAFTTYNWLTQFDGVEEYRFLPVAVEDVFRAKRTAFLLSGLPVAIVGYLAALAWFGASALDALLGGVLLVGLSLYFYGVTVAVAGFSPNEFLFDGVRFGSFFLGVALPLIPVLVVGFVLVPRSLAVELSAGLLLAAVALGALGLWLSERAAARWGEAFRAGRAGSGGEGE